VVLIRDAVSRDLESITGIYNEAVLTTAATFDTSPKTMEDRREWFEGHGEKHPVLVAVVSDAVVGWGSLSAWSDRRAYEDSVEISAYVKEGFRGRGIGRRLTAALLDEGKKRGLRTVIAQIESSNAASIHLLESSGFENIGTLRQVGRKFGRLLDVCILQMVFDDTGRR
jgi:phosphinothricin acetyltransferase